MARLIDADKISYERAHLIYPDGSECLGYRAVASSAEINAALTVDAVEVVRCKDCREWRRDRGVVDSPNGHCFYHETHVNEYDFCSYGERKDGDD